MTNDGINLDEFFKHTDYAVTGSLCLDPEDIKTTEEINQNMRKVQKDAAYRSARSTELSRGLKLKSRVRN